MDFDGVMAQISGGTEDNSTETLETPPVDTGQDDAGGEDDSSDNSQETGQQVGFDPNSITDPQLQAAYKSMQAAFTPKLQEAAQLRERYGDLDPAAVQAVRQYQQLLKTDPLAAREYLVSQQKWIEQQVGLNTQPDPFEGVEPLTPTEKSLLEASRQMWQRLQQQEQQATQLRFARQAEMVERQFAQLEGKYKTTIPLEDRHDVWNFMAQNGIQNVETAWKALTFDKAMQKGMQKAAQVVAKKQNQPPAPTNRQGRSAPQQSSKAKGVAGHFEEAWSQFGRD